jgi:hypothetical protein
MPKSKAYRSYLHKHVEIIRQLRKEKKTWQEIVDYLAAQHGITVTLQGVQSFFKRASAQRSPLGFPHPKQYELEPIGRDVEPQLDLSISSAANPISNPTTHSPTSADALIETRKGDVLKRALQKRLQVEAEQRNSSL